MVRPTKVDHQTRAQEHERNPEQQTYVLKSGGGPDDKAEDWGPEAGTHVIYLKHVPGPGDGEIVGNQHKIVEVLIPEVEAEEEGGRADASSQDRGASEQLVPDEMSSGAPFLPSSEDKEHAETHDDERNEAST
jgi:hypothetical protein